MYVVPFWGPNKDPYPKTTPNPKKEPTLEGPGRV